MGCSGTKILDNKGEHINKDSNPSHYNNDNDKNLPSTKKNNDKDNLNSQDAGTFQTNIAVTDANKILEQIKIETKMLVGQNKEAITKNYKPEKKIGSGTFGKVYKVLHIPTGIYRAMKVVRRDTVQFQDDDQKFLMEIQVLQNMDHPNILKVFEYFVDHNYYYVITEYFPGGELYEQIYKLQYYNEMDAAHIMQQLLSAVTYLHLHKIVHRDLKPENMMLETTNKGDLTIKLIDFGAANFFTQEKEHLTLKVGTPYYIAPEVIKRKYDYKCDLWSCGVILYILLCGYPPFDGDDDESIMENVMKGSLEFHGPEWSVISKDAIDLIKKLLIRDTNQRISAPEALKHPWIQTNVQKRLEVMKSKINLPKLSLQDALQKFSSKQKLQQASIAFIVHQISSNEMTKKLREIFKQLDESGEGLLSLEELKKGYKKFFKDSLSDKDFEDLVNTIDQDKSGQISLEEFLRATIQYETLMTNSNLEMAFNFFDKDKSGKLSADEIKEVLGVTGSDDTSKQLIKTIIEEVDTNGDGLVSLEEFKNMMIRNTSKR